MMTRILIVDDEPAIRRLVRVAAERAGYVVIEAGDAGEALARARAPVPDLALLDLGLPDRDGLELVPIFKTAGITTIVLTARDTTDEKVAALDLGADDYVVKPFDTAELLARIRVALRRSESNAGTPEHLAAGDVAIDLHARRVTRGDIDVHLTRKEFALLAELARHAGRVLTHTHLLRIVWGEAHTGDVEYLRVAVRSLRAKLEPNPAAPTLIVNEPGVGYRLSV